jgi:hypothetical protein
VEETTYPNKKMTACDKQRGAVAVNTESGARIRGCRNGRSHGVDEYFDVEWLLQAGKGAGTALFKGMRRSAHEYDRHSGRAARILDASFVSPMPGIMTSVTTAEYSCAWRGAVQYSENR